ncbi:MAG: alpha/beta hydrolase [Pseudomonadota bacterium]
MRLAHLAFVLLLAACASGAEYAERAEERYPPVGQFMVIDGARLHFVDQGIGPAVIFIHGANSNLRDWTFEIMGRLSPNHRVIAFDRPGHGHSDAAGVGVSPKEQALYLAGAARQIGVDKAIIVGHSLGGAVALAWAIERPEMVEAVVTLAGTSHPYSGRGDTLYWLASRSVTGPIAESAARAYIGEEPPEDLIFDVFAPNEVIEGYGEHIGASLALRPGSFERNADEINQLSGHLELQRLNYDRIVAPVVMMHGESDRTVLLDDHAVKLYGELQTASLIIMPGVGHMIHQVAVDKIVSEIENLTYGAPLSPSG